MVFGVVGVDTGKTFIYLILFFSIVLTQLGLLPRHLRPPHPNGHGTPRFNTPLNTRSMVIHGR